MTNRFGTEQNSPGVRKPVATKLCFPQGLRRVMICVMKPLCTLLALGLAFAASPAAAQTPPGNYKLHEMNFDMWCQETKHYPPERCDKRMPADDAEFQAYRNTVEKYELENLKQQRQGRDLDRAILHNDPVDNPTGTRIGPNP
jgi:hypothetical protein